MAVKNIMKEPNYIKIHLYLIYSNNQLNCFEKNSSMKKIHTGLQDNTIIIYHTFYRNVRKSVGAQKSNGEECVVSICTDDNSCSLRASTVLVVALSGLSLKLTYHMYRMFRENAYEFMIETKQHIPMT